MLVANIPTKIPTIFASSAPGGNVTSPIPTTAQSGGLVSWPTGFQTINFTPVAAGGVPPWGKDFNGLFQVFTGWLQWYQAGGPIAWDSAFSAAVGGYVNGAVVLSATVAAKYWRSIVDANVTNPDTGGAGWVALSQGVPNVRTFLASQTYTETSGTRAILIEVQAPGSGGGSSQATSGSTIAMGISGGGGAYARKYISSGFSGAAITVGAAGTGGTAGGNGGNGGTASFIGSFGSVICSGGLGGTAGGQVNTSLFGVSAAASGGTSTGGDINIPGQISTPNVNFSGGNICVGHAGDSQLGRSGVGFGVSADGVAGQGYGAGGTGACSNVSSAAHNGGAGAPGVVIVYEFF